MNGINYATTPPPASMSSGPPPTSLGFQASGRSFGGNGGTGMGRMLMQLLAKPSTPAPTAGPGMVGGTIPSTAFPTSSASASLPSAQAPFLASGKGTPNMDFLNNPYYKTGFTGLAHY